MSWLYSLIFAGLLFSSDGGSAADRVSDNKTERAAATQDTADVTEKFEQNYPLNADGRVSVSNVNGSITIESWEQNEVKLEALKIADLPEALASIRLEIQSSPERLRIKAQFDRPASNQKGRTRKREVQFRLWVPQSATLDEIETVNGTVLVRNFSATTKISTVNGSISAANLGGSVSLSTVNGEVSAEFTRVDAASQIDLETVNGTIKAVFPSDIDAIVRAESVNGEIKNDFGLPVRKGRYIGRNLSGRIGGGSARVKLSSVNGVLTIGRKNDGKTVKPSVDLLEEEGERAAIAAPMRIPKIAREEMKRDIEDAIRSAEMRAVEMAEAQKAIAELIPELTRIPIESIAKVEAELASEEFQAKMKEAVAAQSAALARMRDVNWPKMPTTIKQRSNNFQIKSGSSISVEAKGCDVRVTGWDRAEVKYVLTEESSIADLKPVEVIEQQTESQLSLTFNNESGKPFNPNTRIRENRVRVDIFVPAKTSLRLKSDGEIRVSHVSGIVELSAADQPVNLRDMAGKVKLEADGALVRLIGFKGELDSTTDSGDVYLEGEFTGLTSSSGAGNIILSVAENSNFEISSNKQAEADGVLIARSENNELRVGHGGPVYHFNLGTGKLLVKRTYNTEVY